MSKSKLLALDPGHGGKDPGAIGPSGIQEKVINLAVAKKVVNFLKPVVDVMLTRDTDKALGNTLGADLSARASIANQAKADVVVSIHCNSADASSAHGTETFSYSDSVQGKLLAQKLQTRLVSALDLTDRGCKESRFAVVRQTNMPAALVELAFISNPTEEALLENDEFQNKAAWAIAQGICDFLGVELQTTVPAQEAQADPDIVIINAGGQTFEGKLIDGKTWIPLRAVLEVLGHKVTWDETTRTVDIK